MKTRSGNFSATAIRGRACLYEIAGVVKDASIADDDGKRIGPFFFLPEAQYTVYPKPDDTQSDLATHYLHDVILLLKPGAVISREKIKQAVAAIHPNLPVGSVRSLREQVADAFRQQRLIARLTSFFAILSVVLAAIGIYGVIAYDAGQRTSEVGVRMALGAGRIDVITLIIRGAAALILLGRSLVCRLPTGRPMYWAVNSTERIRTIPR